MDDKQRAVALLRVANAITGDPEPNRRLRRAAARNARKSGRPKRGRRG